ncbi:MAG: transketolase [Desulfobacterales bacterium]|nr:transketolase [Desulfobacterales bacterium]
MDNRSLHLRKIVINMIECSRRGHIGAAFSLIEILRVLYDDILRFDSKKPKWENRDRCILSKGHGCLALYAILSDKGFFPKEELKNFCQKDGILGGHPEYGKIPGVEASTGSLGHGLSIGIGFALNARYEKKDSKTFVILGDGESNEGSIWEAAMCASKHKLSNLIVIIDYNKFQSYGSTFEVQNLEPFADKWRSFGFGVKEINGHDIESLRNIFSKTPIEEGKPSAVICHTIKGRGISFAENNQEWHHKNKISDNEIKLLYQEVERLA